MQVGRQHGKNVRRQLNTLKRGWSWFSYFQGGLSVFWPHWDDALHLKYIYLTEKPVPECSGFVFWGKQVNDECLSKEELLFLLWLWLGMVSTLISVASCLQRGQSLDLAGRIFAVQQFGIQINEVGTSKQHGLLIVCTWLGSMAKMHINY